MLRAAERGECLEPVGGSEAGTQLRNLATSQFPKTRQDWIAQEVEEAGGQRSNRDLSQSFKRMKVTRGEVGPIDLFSQVYGCHAGVRKL